MNKDKDPHDNRDKEKVKSKGTIMPTRIARYPDDVPVLMALYEERKAERIAEFGGEASALAIFNDWRDGRITIVVHTANNGTVMGAGAFYNFGGGLWEGLTAWWKIGASVSTIRTRTREILLDLANRIPAGQRSTTRVRTHVIEGSTWDTYFSARSSWITRQFIGVIHDRRIVQFTATAQGILDNI